ncbi:MAG: hypothetical protein B6I26_00850 [Desulfobacteraceae bacterium 4572_130]|nr:MAG: hypothetical protein B6I26_00850 [Desulfobacteraceae bacterium 4572_130]
MIKKKYIIVIQCHIVKEYCSGFLCEHTFNKRVDCFSCYDSNNNLRFLSITCGGCCGRSTLRKLQDFISQAEAREKIIKNEIVVHLSSCVSFESFHGPECPHKEYISKIITEKAGLDLVYGSRLSPITEARRKKNIYKTR